MMSLTECYQDVALPQNIVYSSPSDYWQFSLHFPLDFSPLNAFFIWEAFLIVHFLVEIIIIKVRDRFVLLSFSTPLPIFFCFLACLLCFTFLSILHNTGIKMVIGVGKCFTSAFIWCWHGIRSRFVIFNECNLCSTRNISSSSFFMLAIFIKKKQSTSVSKNLDLKRNKWNLCSYNLQVRVCEWKLFN